MTARVIFAVASSSLDLASTRYRAMMPAIGLEGLGFSCEVTDRPLGEAEIQGARCIV